MLIAFEMAVSHVNSFLIQETRVFVGSLGAKDFSCALRKTMKYVENLCHGIVYLFLFGVFLFSIFAATHVA